jgi:phosphatidylethanolamine-binding protein (PEBP) family uncharacterized protein
MKSAVVAVAATVVAVSVSMPAHAMSASFSWSGIPACSGTSPAFTVSGAPPATTNLRFVMRDQNVPDYNHGGSTVPLSGNRVAQGAISYKGPCPPGGQTHMYIWTIEALDASGKVLATTTARGQFPPK